MTLYEQYYDGVYANKRDALIPKAVAKANRNFGSACKNKGNRKALERFAAGWNKCFAATMEELVTLAGLRK